MESKMRGGAEAYSKVHLDKLLKENRELNQRLDSTQRENKQLKKSYLDLTVKFDMLSMERGRKGVNHYYDLDTVMINQADAESPLDENDRANLELTDTSQSKKRDGRLFSFKSALKSHTGPVYVVQHSPCGKLLASGSLDTNVLLWDAYQHRLVKRMLEHTSAVSDLCWTYDSAAVLSASLDGSAKVWSVEAEAPISSYELKRGFALSVRCNPQDKRIFMVGMSDKCVLVCDSREAKPVATVEMESMANCLYVYRDGQLFMVGDSGGKLSTFHVGTGQCLESIVVEETRQAISHICLPYSEHDEQEVRYIGVNSHDNVLRVYDRGSMPPTTTLRLHAAVRGHVNKGWPIRSGFYMGSDYQTITSSKSVASTETAADDDDRRRPRCIDETMVVATGSANGYACVFDVGQRHARETPIQKLEGHGHRVYCADFHPTEAVLATSSADGVIRIWGAKAKRVLL